MLSGTQAPAVPQQKKQWGWVVAATGSGREMESVPFGIVITRESRTLAFAGQRDMSCLYGAAAQSVRRCR